MDLDERTLTSVAAYDEHAAAYQQSLRLKRPVADVRRFADRARRDDLVLDAGCGPANDLRLLRDAGVHPVGVDLAMGALREARMLLPRHPLVQAPLHALPFRDRSFGGLWMSGAFTHLPRSAWRPVFADLLRVVDHGPVYLACYRGTADLEPLDDPVLGKVYVSAATATEIEALFASHGLREVSIELRPDPVHDRRRPWVVALGTMVR
ncbi:MAG: class I SAM-dependent methyltransferase [Actinobacteria bacterium]|nr:class I SAM-dependent methyltransferase [Actinomycetota bacterium]